MLDNNAYARYFIEADELLSIADAKNLIIIDLCKKSQYEKAHIPGAHYVSYNDIVKNDKPIMGLLPDDDVFSNLLSHLGMTNKSLVVAYDDEGGGCAARFVWTLNVYNHTTAVVLNGGLHNWANSGLPLTNKTTHQPALSNYRVKKTHRHTATSAYVQTHLNDETVVFVDARSLAEYTGEKKFSAKAGHIPGAIHFEWTRAMNLNDNLRCLPANTLLQTLKAIGVDKDKEIICYCQSHHRSSYTWLVLKSLGYENVLGYPGSWSDWGNNATTVVEK